MLRDINYLTRYHEALQQINPQHLARYLRSQGWTQSTPWRDKGFDWITPEGEITLVPIDPALQHYTSTIAELLEMFVTKDITFEDVIVFASIAPCDIVRQHIDEPATTSGSCSLEEARNGLDAMKNLLNASSRRHAMRHRTGNRIATDYLRNCRAGQTEFGSYVFKVYTPIVVPNTVTDLKTFGRAATVAAIENVQYLSSDAFTFEEPLPPEMDWHVAESIMKMRPSAEIFGASTTLTASFLKGMEPGVELEMPGEKIEVKLSPAIFDRAQSLYESLRNEELFERAVFKGHITDLHQDAPGAKQRDCRVTVLGYFGSRSRNVTLRLTDRDYAQAIKWHGKELLVEIEAKIDKRWRSWTTVEYYRFEPLEPPRNTESSLF
ncbi:MAG TPA: hypothetical protein VF595_11705 [Tepidisphaeraceae bacterium]|jgi:hypothetical protein